MNGDPPVPAAETLVPGPGSGGRGTARVAQADTVAFEVARAAPRLLKIVGTVVAPTTVLAALLVYFGLLYAVGYFRYLGVNFTVLNLASQDYLVLSADGAIIPLVLFAGAALLSLWVYQLPLERLSGKPRSIARWVLMPAVAGAGSTLVALAAADALFGAPVFPEGFWEARGLSLAVGVLLLAYAGRLRRGLVTAPPGSHRRDVPDALTVARWGGLLVMVSVGLFWAVGSYAIGVGARGAQGLVADLACAPDVILYSEKSLNLHVRGVGEVAESGRDTAYGFRYTGLKLVPQSGDRYLFLPDGWTPAGRPAILLPRTDTLRLEFISVAENRPDTCRA
jgi:hypothetical protein